MSSDPNADDVYQPTGDNEEQEDAAPLDLEDALQRAEDAQAAVADEATAERVRAAVLGLGDDTPARTFAEACRGA